MSRRRHVEEQPTIAAAAAARADAFPAGVCLVCGQTARTFTAREVPELLLFLGGKAPFRDLSSAARTLLPGPGCLVAPLSGVSVCAGGGS